MLNLTKGMLVEYSQSIPPLILAFEFNPETITRSRSVTLKTETVPGTRSGYDFSSPNETPRISQCATVQQESFTLKILLDATDRMNRGDPIATQLGIEPELDTLRTMLEPKTQGPEGQTTLASLDLTDAPAFQRQEMASVHLFIWGSHVLPVFLTEVRAEEVAHLPSLKPYRAKVDLTMQVIEGNNPFYLTEKARQVASAALNTLGSIPRIF